MKTLRSYTHCLHTALLCLSALFLLSCTTEDPKDFYKVGMGTLIKKNMGRYPYSILMDEEEEPFIITNSDMLTEYGDKKTGQRLIVSYHFTEKRKNHTWIKLQEVFSVLTKPLAHPANQAEMEKLGKDPIQIVYAWMGGGHLNLKLRVQSSLTAGKKHLINAYDTGVTDSEGYRLFCICHNLNGIKPNIWSPPFYVSFPLPQDEDLDEFRLIYINEYGEPKIITVED